MGYVIVVIGSILFGIFPSIQKSVMTSGVTPIALVAVCNGIACVVALGISLVQRRTIRVSRRELLSLLLIGALGLFLTDFLLNVAYNYIPVGYVTMIHFLYPSIVCIVLALFFRERLTKGKVAAIVMSIVGMALLTSGGGLSGSVFGIAIAFASSLTYVFFILATERTSASGIDPIVRVFYTNLVAAVIALVIALPTHATFPTTTFQWGGSLIVGVMLCVGIYMLNIGIERINASVTSFINMIEPITSLIVSAIVFAFAVSPLNIAGCVLILASMVTATRNSSS